MYRTRCSSRFRSTPTPPFHRGIRRGQRPHGGGWRDINDANHPRSSSEYIENGRQHTGPVLADLSPSLTGGRTASGGREREPPRVARTPPGGDARRAGSLLIWICEISPPAASASPQRM